MREASVKKDSKLSAYFSGLVAVCVDEDGQCLYLVDSEGQFSLEEAAVIESGEVVPPERHHLPFLLPRANEVMKYIKQDDPALYPDVLTYLQRFSALDDLQWSLVAHYVFLSYLHDHPGIGYCPILLFYAVPERGKSRTGKSVAYLAFRGIHLNELREPNIFRYSENLHGTLFFDLMDVWKKAERNGCEDILLGRFEKGQKSSRVLYPEKGPFKDTVYYDIYGPTIIATNEPLHKILDTRCLPIIMPNRPGNYENPREETALELKERLTAWRAKALSCQLPDLIPLEGISGRLWDISKPLFQVGSLVHPHGFTSLRESLFTIAGDRSEAKKETIEGLLIRIIKELSAERDLEGLPYWTLKTSDILKKLNEDRPADKQYTAPWIGKKLKSMSLRHRTVNGRSEIMLTSNEYWTLMEQYGCYSREECQLTATPTETLPIITQHNQYGAGVVGSDRVSGEPWNENEFIESLSDREREEFRERVSILIADGQLMPEDAEEDAYIMILRRRDGNEE